MTNRTPGADDATQFVAMVESHFDPIWRYLRRRVGAAADADDLCAETFAVAWRRRSALPPADEQRMWLFGVARHVLANHRRSAERSERLVRRIGALPRPVAPEPEAPETAVWRALAALTDADRDLVLMRSWDQLSVSEIASLLDCTPNAASVRLHKARRRLAAALAEIEGTDRRDPGHESDDPALTKEHDRG